MNRSEQREQSRRGPSQFEIDLRNEVNFHKWVLRAVVVFLAALVTAVLFLGGLLVTQ